MFVLFPFLGTSISYFDLGFVCFKLPRLTSRPVDKALKRPPIAYLTKLQKFNKMNAVTLLIRGKHSWRHTFIWRHTDVVIMICLDAVISDQLLSIFYYSKKEFQNIFNPKGQSCVQDNNVKTANKHTNVFNVLKKFYTPWRELQQRNFSFHVPSIPGHKKQWSAPTPSIICRNSHNVR